MFCTVHIWSSDLVPEASSLSHVVYADIMVSMTAELDSCSPIETQLYGNKDVNPLSLSRVHNTHTRGEHGELS